MKTSTFDIARTLFSRFPELTPLSDTLTEAVAALCACAPDAVRPNSAFDEWAAKVAVACNYQTIGRYEVGSLLGMNASDRATIFLDATSRLYSGQISADEGLRLYRLRYGETGYLNVFDNVANSGGGSGSSGGSRIYHK